MFADVLESYGDATAVVTDDDRTITYRDLARLADRLAEPLGMPTPGRSAKCALVFLCAGNHPESLAAYLGCLRRGHVPLLLPESVRPELLAGLRERYRPDFLWVPLDDDDATPGAGAAVGDAVEVCREGRYALYRCGDGDGDGVDGLHADLALLLSTSGSTGSPRLVRLSRRNLQANAESIVEYLGLTPGERAITALPMSYSYGLSVIHSHLACGATLLLTGETAIQRRFWEFFERSGGTSLSGVPYTYMIYRRAGLLKKELPALRSMTQAGGRMAPEDVRRFAEWCDGRGVKFFVMYGQTEATARMAYLPPERVLEKPGAVGVAIPGGRFRICPPDGAADGGETGGEMTEITSPGVAGELIYEGDNVSLGYAECRADLSLGDVNRGRLATGDLAVYDTDGFVSIVGRLKRFIKMTGNRLGLDDVERGLREAGIEAVCGGRDDLLGVAVSPRVDPESVRRVIVERFRLHHSMVRVVPMEPEAVPRSESGKILYEELFREVL